MTLQQLQDFVAVVMNGGYRAAARVEGRSQSALTKNIASLEREYAITLLDRQGSGVVLTGDGEEFLRYAQPLLAEAARASDWLSTSRRKRAASVALGASIEPSLTIVPPVLDDFRRVCPDVTVRITHGVVGELIAGVQENRLELAITHLPLGTPTGGLIVDPLYQAEAVIAARRDHPLITMRSAQDLEASDWVVVGDPLQPGTNDASIREVFDQQSRRRPRVVFVTDSLFHAVTMLIASDRIARLPGAILQHPLVAGRLVALALPTAMPPFRVALLRKSSRHLTREGQTLAAMLTSYTRIKRRS